MSVISKSWKHHISLYYPPFPFAGDTQEQQNSIREKGAAAMPSLLPASLGLFFSIFLLASSSASEYDTVVVTSSGPIKGKRVPADSGSTTAYLGIPYAEPPVGKLRFQKPLPHQSWSHVLEATSFGNACFQKSFFASPFNNMWVANGPYSEDCLFLNIWVPHPRPSLPVPVLIWIHGGGFVAGAGSLDLYNGACLAAAENVIVASMNYRLGILGFLFFPPDAPGNVGLWDQHLALKWVKENAAVFGGDPAQLTLLGHSAGAASVGFHLLSPASQPLFAQAVVQSGAPNAPWAWKHPENAKMVTLHVSSLLGCGEQNHSAVVSCIQDKEAHEVFYVWDRLFSPTTDGDFLPGEPKKLLQTGLIQVKPLLIGITGDDGSVFISAPTGEGGILTWEQLLQGISILLRKPYNDDVKTVAVKYAEEGHGPEQYRRALAQFGRDYFFVCPMAEVAGKMAGGGSPVYVYSFNHHISGSIWQEWMGAAHGVEVPYLFGTLSSLPRANQTNTETDAALSHKVMRYWAEFARSGNPTGTSMSNEVQWPLYNTTEQKFFHISTEAPEVRQISPAHHCDILAAHKFNSTHTKKPPKESAVPILEKDMKNETRT
ncbi:cholinesterase-like isoform X2 [Rhineura floridana]|uniref:cholinesterase-like isoform X2 n=1 Tax=Rhineura floridana TaxID=261503 RepID=UPI002AC83001|nr:cholinesterase-like isoform X2 [Rhineura floridana]